MWVWFFSCSCTQFCSRFFLLSRHFIATIILLKGKRFTMAILTTLQKQTTFVLLSLAYILSIFFLTNGKVFRKLAFHFLLLDVSLLLLLRWWMANYRPSFKLNSIFICIFISFIRNVFVFFILFLVCCSSLIKNCFSSLLQITRNFYVFLWNCSFFFSVFLSVLFSLSTIIYIELR